MSVKPEGHLGEIKKLMFCIIQFKLKICISILILTYYQSNMLYSLTPSSACYPFKIIYFIFNRGVGTDIQRNFCTPCHDNTLMTSWLYDNSVTQNDKQSQSLADVNVSALKECVRSCC